MGICERKLWQQLRCVPQLAQFTKNFRNFAQHKLTDKTTGRDFAAGILATSDTLSFFLSLLLFINFILRHLLLVDFLFRPMKYRRRQWCSSCVFETVLIRSEWKIMETKQYSSSSSSSRKSLSECLQKCFTNNATTTIHHYEP